MEARESAPASSTGSPGPAAAGATVPTGSGEAAGARFGLWVVLAGLGVALVAFALTILAFDSAADVSTALAPLTGLIGTIIGAYFGVQVGASGKAEAEAARTVAEDQAKKLAAAGPTDLSLQLLGVDLPRSSSSADQA